MDLSLGLISLTISLFCIVISQNIYIKRKIIDKIKLRSSHTTLATRTGGIAIFSTIFLISTYYYLAGKEIYDFSLLIPLIILLIVGLYDDVYDVDFILKFIFQVVAAKIIIDNGLIIDNLHGVLGIYEIGRIQAQLLTMFIIVAIINAINFIDGIDGLAITAITFFILSFEFFAYTTSPFFILSQITIFSLLPIYYFNIRQHNKVFLGDSGSLFLGGLVSIYVVYILNNDYIIKEAYDLNKVIYVFSILTYPIIDIVRVVFIRIYNKKSPFLPDKNHIHHLIVSKFDHHYFTVFLIYLANSLLLVLLQIVF
jgi:UDP-N-acetylmuramyl pentapeptide phosphotransferase/UDP-N-acetylglucosamine-1-phosphate transferase